MTILIRTLYFTVTSITITIKETVKYDVPLNRWAVVDRDCLHIMRTPYNSFYIRIVPMHFIVSLKSNKKPSRMSGWDPMNIPKVTVTNFRMTDEYFNQFLWTSTCNMLCMLIIFYSPLDFSWIHCARMKQRIQFVPFYFVFFTLSVYHTQYMYVCCYIRSAMVQLNCSMLGFLPPLIQLWAMLCYLVVFL